MIIKTSEWLRMSKQQRYYLLAGISYIQQQQKKRKFRNICRIYKTNVIGEGMYSITINQFRKFLYTLAKFLGDVNAIQKGTIGKRIVRRIAGKITGRLLGKLFK
ncbi:hypothetical protein C0971_12025 [Bacillus methanolicus]|uniref:hypothetical protein n=1 Tax=Bacillus methanolicus TaxID=1471 RepID=UPI00200F4E0A|nr:hypothetical protein [Bacillus methanolicus]UQD52675.1 hypothetical protein C0971_12025 [Bacillus methanolicus]